jgi:hypothetical protein
MFMLITIIVDQAEFDPGGPREYVRRVRPHAPVDPVVRFETPPGYQGQVDFGTFQLPWGRRKKG